MWLLMYLDGTLLLGVVVNQLSTSNLFDPGEADQYGVWSKLVPFL